jgi:hypothetical protein
MAAVINDPYGGVILAVTQKLYSADAFLGEASTALIAYRLVGSSCFKNFLLEGDALLVILAVN